MIRIVGPTLVVATLACGASRRLDPDRGCEDACPNALCTEGAARCSGAAIEVCTGGAWQLDRTCDPGERCDEAGSVPECLPAPCPQGFRADSVEATADVLVSPTAQYLRALEIAVGGGRELSLQNF